MSKGRKGRRDIEETGFSFCLNPGNYNLLGRILSNNFGYGHRLGHFIHLLLLCSDFLSLVAHRFCTAIYYRPSFAFLSCSYKSSSLLIN